MFDEYLTFDDHITSVCSKISKSLFCINRIKNFVPHATLKTLYHAMVHSHLMYCINVYSCANSSSLNKLRIKQKEAIRIISSSGYRDHTGPLFAQLKILPLDLLIKFSTLKLMHSFKNNLLPISFAELWSTNRERNPKRALRNADDFYIPPHTLATIKRLPLFTFPRVWNEEETAKNIPSQPRYLKIVKTALLSSIPAQAV